ncbi:hypothetical protein NHX12_020755 [Muraenolepis orangiensis]|uniref:Nuclear-interacting partner of ALK n=1 Tax=Muraenolepis orangiensis TaxID=630683 RepID=A0A9Q0ES62_9TELE|nr:hypothetical protein NHX12_020755 [Muraenolepis orangiensis]
MATLSSRGGRLGNSNQQPKSSFTSPEKVRELLSQGVSPRCAQYGWTNVSSDMLKCSSCQAFLCASLSPTLDLEKYESRIAEISRQLQTQHEKFCPWPDFPSPERFWLVPASEPTALLSAFLERFQSVCLLDLQLPVLKPEHLKSMSLTEDVISILLQLIEEEQKKRGEVHPSEALAIQVAACIVSLCGWAASPSLSLPILTCSFCMRKVGLWNFHQMDGTVAEDESPAARGKRPPPRGKGQDGAASPQNTPKRIRLSSAGGPAGPLQKNAFDPLAQHRDWCPWVNAVKEDADRRAAAPQGEDSVLQQQGWKAALHLLIAMKKNSNPSEGSPAECPQDKSKRVFAIFRQWQVPAPAQ